MSRKLIVILTTSDPRIDRRVQKVAGVLAEHYEVKWWGVKRHSLPDFDRQFLVTRTKTVFKKSFLFYLEITIRWLFGLLRERPDLIYAVDSDSILSSAFYRQFFQTELVLDFHEWFEEVPELKEKPLRRKIWTAINRFGLRKASVALTVGPALAAELQKKYNYPFEVIRNLPDLVSSDKLQPPTDLVKLVYLGHLNEGRGLHQLVRAMRNLPGFELNLLGAGDLYKELNHLVKSEGLEQKVHFHGYVAPEQISNILSKMHVGMNLLESRSLSYYFSLANKAFDYLHAGLPSISMDYPEYKNLNVQFEVSVLLPELTESAISKACHEITTAPLWQILHGNCLKAKQVFNWTNEKDKLIQVVSQLL